MMQRADNPQVPWLGYTLLNILDGINRLRARRWSVRYEYLFLRPSGADLAEIGRFADEGLLRPVVGTRVKMQDIDGLRKAAGTVYEEKGGLGKVVIEVR